jgi:hypothetical protein
LAPPISPSLGIFIAKGFYYYFPGARGTLSFKKSEKKFLSLYFLSALLLFSRFSFL